MGKLADIKTKENDSSVVSFIKQVADEQKRNDCQTILQMMHKATGDEPKMWGGSIIGFGNLILKSPNTGREVAWFKMGFSPRKANFALYLGLNIQKYADELKRLGKHKTGVGCLYINKIADIDTMILEIMINKSIKKESN